MKKLLYKEIRLGMHPTNPLFLGLSAMLLIPNYPYYVIFFYTTLALFFTCLSARENHDMEYSMLLPVDKADLVKSRFLYAVLLEMAQVLCAIPFALLRRKLNSDPNLAGMDANAALFGLSLLMLGVFNWVFFSRYYANPQKVGKSFCLACVAVFCYVLLAESAAFAAPFFRNVLDTPDPAHMGVKLTVLAAGAMLYVLLTLWALRRSIRRFTALDL